MIVMLNQLELQEQGYSREVVDAYKKYCYAKMQKQNLKQLGVTAFTDSQREKFYKAEFEFIKVAENNQVFDTMAEIKAFVKKVTKTKLWQDIKNHQVTDIIYCGTTRVNCHAWARPGEICFNMDYDIDKYTILHELCHCAGYNNHDVGFRKALMRLVSRFMGTKDLKKWKQAMKEGKIKLNYPSTEAKPIEEWYKGYKRAMAMRKACA